jgi:hypothetical protein
MNLDPFRSPLAHREKSSKDSLIKQGKKVSYDSLIQKYSKPCRILGLVDATGSMQPVWNQTRDSIKELISRLLKVGQFELSWVAYRDYCDGYRIIEQSNWSNSVDELNKFLSKITCNGGGDFPEAVEKALEVGVIEEEVSRIILIGDAPPHEDRDYRERAIALGQKKRPVYSFVVNNDPDTYRTFTEISRLSGGICSPLKDDKDILDLIAITVVDEMGGKKSLDKYVKQYGATLSPTVQTFIKQLPPNNK